MDHVSGEQQFPLSASFVLNEPVNCRVNQVWTVPSLTNTLNIMKFLEIEGALKHLNGDYLNAPNIHVSYVNASQDRYQKSRIIHWYLRNSGIVHNIYCMLHVWYRINKS